MNTEKKNNILQVLQENPTISNRDIGKILNMPKSTVSSYLIKMNIKRDRKKQQRLNNTCREKKCIINNEAEQVILGSILGDGYVSKYRKPKDTKLLLNSYLQITHGVKQKEYIEFKKGILERNNIKCYLTFIDGNKIKEHYIKGIKVKENGSYRLKTIRNVSFNFYRDVFYSDKKHLSKYLYKLDALGLAIWYMDDGYYCNNNIHICTNCFTIKEVRLLQEILKHNFNIDTTIQKSNLKQPILYIKTCSKQLFINIVSPYICNCLKYKIGT